MKRIGILLGFAGLGWVAWTAAEVRAVPGAATTGKPDKPQASVVQPAAPARDEVLRPVPRAPIGGGAVLLMPVAGADPERFRHSFVENRGGRLHNAIDILAPRGTPVVAVADGVVAKIFNSAKGGLTVYQFDPTGTHCYYYAHLDSYAPGLHEGQQLRRGELVGTVGTTGNAPPGTPHLHFAVNVLDADRRWWGGTPIDPYPLLAGR